MKNVGPQIYTVYARKIDAWFSSSQQSQNKLEKLSGRQEKTLINLSDDSVRDLDDAF